MACPCPACYRSETHREKDTLFPAPKTRHRYFPRQPVTSPPKNTFRKTFTLIRYAKKSQNPFFLRKNFDFFRKSGNNPGKRSKKAVAHALRHRSRPPTNPVTRKHVAESPRQAPPKNILCIKEHRQKLSVLYTVPIRIPGKTEVVQVRLSRPATLCRGVCTYPRSVHRVSVSGSRESSFCRKVG